MDRRGFFSSIGLAAATPYASAEQPEERERERVIEPGPKLWIPRRHADYLYVAWTLSQVHRAYAECCEDTIQPSIIACGAGAFNMFLNAFKPEIRPGNANEGMRSSGPFGRAGYMTFPYLKAEVVLSKGVDCDDLWILTPGQPHSEKHNAHLFWAHRQCQYQSGL